jgi:rhodanese-related sulfurtransferase
VFLVAFIANALGPYIAVCDTGRRSSAAAFLLSERGFDAYCLQGGLTGNKLGPD